MLQSCQLIHDGEVLCTWDVYAFASQEEIKDELFKLLSPNQQMEIDRKERLKWNDPDSNADLKHVLSITKL